MVGHKSIWRLARELQTYPELLAGLCAFHEITIVDGPRGRMVRDSDCQLVSDLLFVWRSRPNSATCQVDVPGESQSITVLRPSSVADLT